MPTFRVGEGEILVVLVRCLDELDELEGVETVWESLEILCSCGREEEIISCIDTGSIKRLMKIKW